MLDELGYLALPEGAAELVFQVISERNERGSVIVTTNLPFGEWTKVFPDPRLAKAVVDRITHKAHIIDTGARLGNWSQTESRCSRPGPINFAVPGFKQLDWRWNSCWEGYDPLMNDIITPMYTSALVAPEMAITDSLPEPYDGQSGTYRYRAGPGGPWI